MAGGDRHGAAVRAVSTADRPGGIAILTTILAIAAYRLKSSPHGNTNRQND